MVKKKELLLLVLGRHQRLGDDLGEELLEVLEVLELLREEPLVWDALLTRALHAAEDRSEPVQGPGHKDEALLGLVLSNGPYACVLVHDAEVVDELGEGIDLLLVEQLPYRQFPHI